MFKTLRDAWSIPEIRKKLLYTLLMLLIFRLGSAVVVPFLDTSTVSTWMASNATGGNFLEYLDIITGGALSQATVFSLSITPYINASIIMQLLTMHCLRWSVCVMRAKRDRKSSTKSQLLFPWHCPCSCPLLII